VSCTGQGKKEVSSFIPLTGVMYRSRKEGGFLLYQYMVWVKRTFFSSFLDWFMVPVNRKFDVFYADWKQ
jgi:hypothetical protein